MPTIPQPYHLVTIGTSLMLAIALQTTVLAAACWLAWRHYRSMPFTVLLAVSCLILLMQRIGQVALYSGSNSVADPGPLILFLRETNSLVVPVIYSLSLLALIGHVALYARVQEQRRGEG